MCTGRVDLAFIFRAFRQGADGVIIGGCWPGECHYVTEGNYDALANVHISRKLMERMGIDPRRVRIEWISAAEGSRFAEVMSEFAAQMRELGPLGRAEGIDGDRMKLDLAAACQLVPYLRLVEREKLRVTEKSEKAYEELYSSARVNRLFDELVEEKLAIVSRPRGPAGAPGAAGDERIAGIIDQHRGNPNALIQVLLEIQHLNRWLPGEVLERVATSLGVPLGKVIQTATFYKTFSLIPKGRHEVHVCRGSSCHVRGSGRVLDAVQERTGLRPGETDEESRFSLETCNCLGYCNSGPGMFVDGKHHGPMTPERVEEVLKEYE